MRINDLKIFVFITQYISIKVHITNSYMRVTQFEKLIYRYYRYVLYRYVDNIFLLLNYILYFQFYFVHLKCTNHLSLKTIEFTSYENIYKLYFSF